MRRTVAILALLAAGCSSAAAPDPFPTLPPGSVPDGPLAEAVVAELDALLDDPLLLSGGDLDVIGGSGDARVAWILVDVLRFHQGQTRGPQVLDALATLTGVTYEASATEPPWVDYNDLLLAHDVPEPPDYLRYKRILHVGFHDRWAPFFDDDASVDWREVTWGGVLRDAIEQLDDPPMVQADGGDWLPDDDVVFGVVVDGQARAYPRRVLQVHELVNDTIGSRSVSVPYCTLCGAAIAYAADDIEGFDRVTFRTSGLLQRSNKLMYDTQTESLFDQLRGTAVSGPMLDAGVELTRLPLVVTTWGQWRAEHPDTLVTPAEIGGRGYGPDPLKGRDDAGPIFPVGRIDPRLPANEPIFGVTTPDGLAMAFVVGTARRELADGAIVEASGVTLELAAGGLVATSRGRSLVGHESFWFAWSQRHPETVIWNR